MEKPNQTTDCILQGKPCIDTTIIYKKKQKEIKPPTVYFTYFSGNPNPDEFSLDLNWLTEYMKSWDKFIK